MRRNNTRYSVIILLYTYDDKLMPSVERKIALTRREGVERGRRRVGEGCLATNKDVWRSLGATCRVSAMPDRRHSGVSLGRGKIGVIPLLHENLIGLSPGARRRINKSSGIR